MPQTFTGQLWTATAKKENKILNGRSRRESYMHLITIVYKMKTLSDNRDKIESIPVSLRVLGFE